MDTEAVDDIVVVLAGGKHRPNRASVGHTQR